MEISYNLLFVLGFSLLPLIKKELSSGESKYLEILRSYYDRKFLFDNTLPMPYIIDCLFGSAFVFGDYNERTVPLILKTSRIIFHLFTVFFIFCLFSQKEGKHIGKKGLTILYSLSPIILSRIFSQYSGSLVNIYCLFFNIVSVYFYFKQKHFLTANFMGLALSSSWSSLSVFIALQMVNFYIFYEDVVDKTKNVYMTCLNMLKNVLMLILIPIIIYFSIFYLSYNLRYLYDPSLDAFSLEFQSTFTNKDIEKCDRLLVNNSIITLINKRYRWYLSVEKKEEQFRIFGSKSLDEKCLWIVRTVSGHDGPIIPGEKVRFIHFLYEKALSLNKVNNKDKFFPLELTDEDLVVESENEQFKFEILNRLGEKGIEARSTLFKLINTNTNMDLCMKKTKKVDSIAGSADMSFYGNKRNLAFYIGDNKSPNKENESEKAFKYPQLSFFEKFFEHHNLLFEKRNLKIIFEGGKGLIEHINVITLFLIPLFLVFNYISICRYEKGFNVTNQFLFIYVLHLLCSFCSYLVMYDELLKDVVDSVLVVLFFSLIENRLSIGYNAFVILEFFFRLYSN